MRATVQQDESVHTRHKIKPKCQNVEIDMRSNQALVFVHVPQLHVHLAFIVGYLPYSQILWFE